MTGRLPARDGCTTLPSRTARGLNRASCGGKVDTRSNATTAPSASSCVRTRDRSTAQRRSISPTLLELNALYAKRMLPFRTASAQSTEIRRAFWRNHPMEVPMFFHTLAEFVATIVIMLIASGTVIGGMFIYRHFKLRAKELEEELDSRDAEAHLGAVEARLRTVETRLGAMEGAIGALVAGLAQPPAPQPLDAPARTVAVGSSRS